MSDKEPDLDLSTLPIRKFYIDGEWAYAILTVYCAASSRYSDSRLFNGNRVNVDRFDVVAVQIA
jgi:hypothetical protein